MRKISTLFQRDHNGDRLVRNEVTPGCGWVLAGEGRATRKFDGSCCRVLGGKLYKRHEIKHAAIIDGQMQRCPPPGFELEELDPVTQKAFGWLPVGDGPEDRWHREAWENLRRQADFEGQTFFNNPPLKDGEPFLKDGTFELLGPKVQGNPEGFPQHTLLPHGVWQLPNVPCDFDGLREYLRVNDIEGIVWWHEDGRMCKLKKRDFGFKRG